MKIEILCTGDEILSGKTVNTNHSHMARRLTENGFEVYWGTIVGDDRQSLTSAFDQASKRADVVIVNGGLGPTVDDLSQEVAAEAAGVELVLNEAWLQRISAWYEGRGRTMPPNNTKQAMLPANAEFIDNPVGTACGFALTINQARFMFTPGVPREMRQMLEEQILPRLQEMRGGKVVTRVKRFHTFGIGESRADGLLEGIEEMVPGNVIKLGFQSHYPQLETKLTAQGEDEQNLTELLKPVENELRKRLGHFVLCEDDETSEGLVIDQIASQSGSLSVVEMDTGGSVTARLLRVQGASETVKQGVVASTLDELNVALGLELEANTNCSIELAARAAMAFKDITGSSHALAILLERAQDNAGGESGADIFIGIADKNGTQQRQSRLPGSRDWIRTGAGELALDCLRRYLLGLPVYERIDFEQH